MWKTGKYWSPCIIRNDKLCIVTRDTVCTYVTIFVAIAKEKIVQVRLWFNKTIIDSDLENIPQVFLKAER